MISLLKNAPFIGLDCEWKCTEVKMMENSVDIYEGPSIMQLASFEVVVIVDMISLKQSHKLNTELSKVFSSPRTSIIGFDINGDLDVLS
jgi:hypothetical protein